MKILMVRAKLDGVGHYRVSIPALALRDRGHTVEILDAPQDKGKKRIYNGWFAGYDVCLLQNLVDPGWIEVIKTIPEEHRPVTVGCIDDLVTGLDKTNPLYDEYRNAAQSFIYCMRLCDGMIFSTEEIRRRYWGYNFNCHVVPNCLDIPGFRNWDLPEERRTERFTVGWLGGTQHLRDEEPMRDGLREFLRQTPEAVFAFCGNAQLGKIWKASIGIPDDQWMFLEPAEFDGYQSRISQFDVGVAPLRDTEFNQCKSDLRLLEYGAWGVPYLASNIAPYRELHAKVWGGALCNQVDWKNDLSVMFQNRDAIKRTGSHLRSWVREHRGHYACGEFWEQALMRAIERAKCQAT